MINPVAFGHRVTALMSTDLITLPPTASMWQVGELFKKYKVHHLAIVDDNGKLLGIISTLDYQLCVNTFPLFQADQASIINETTLSSVPVATIMSKQLATLNPHNTLLDALAIFNDNNFHCLPVTDNKGILVGILTTQDLLVFAYKEPPFSLEKDK